MRFRLFKPGYPVQLAALGLGTLSALGLAAGCAGKEFTAHGTPSAGGSTSGGAGSGGELSSQAGESGSAEGGEAGAPSAGSGGDTPSGGRGGSGGSAGKPAVGCDCKTGEYCQDGTTNCLKCADFSRLEFGTPQKLSTLAQSPLSIERFARSAGSGSALFYVSGAADKSKILYAATPLSGVGSPVSSSVLPESAPLYVGGFAEQNLFFDRQQPAGRKLMLALWSASAPLTKEALMPDPFNTSGSDDYSIAISPNTGHVYWMSTRDGAPELVWQPTGMSAPPPPAPLDLKIKVGSKECARSGDDATPWVNLAGTLLLFRNPSLNDNCEPNDSGAPDLFAASLSSEGKPKAAAIPLESLNTTGGMSRESDPSLTPDSCFVYFASDNGTGDFDLYKAPRN